MKRFILPLLLLAFSLTSTACGGGGGGGNDDLPRLKNATAGFSATPDEIVLCQIQGFQTAYNIVADFSGDVVGGHLLINAIFQPGGQQAIIEADVPGESVGIRGDTLEFVGCVTVGSATRYIDLEVWAVSPSGVDGPPVNLRLD